MATARAASVKESERRAIIWVGPAPNMQRQFKSRRLQVDTRPLKNTSAEREGQWARSCGLVVAFRLRPEFRTVCEQAIKLIHEARRYGLRIQLLGEAAEAAHLEKVMADAGVSMGSSVVVTTTSVDLDDLAEQFSNHSPGPAPTFGKPNCTFTCGADAQLLLRRAFEDCEELHCWRLPHPSGDREVFHVHALLQKSPAGRRLQPFFVKVDNKKAIQDEIEKYETYVDGFVPFYLRPNLVRERSFYTATDGIIVGNFAEHCESFPKAVRRGIGPSIVHALFEETLRGWRVQAHDHGQKQHDLFRSMRGPIRGEDVPAPRVAAAKALGAHSEPTVLAARLAAACKVEHLVAISHRDLHVSNVMVRGRDAIVIDFSSVGIGALVGDPAMLEASLLCALDGPEPTDEFEAWKALSAKLMERSNLEHPPGHVFAPTPMEWLWETVRALRLVGLACETRPYEYAAALAYCLMVQSMVTVNKYEDERRSFAYVLAERILDQVAPKTP